jgi:malonate transporter
VTILFDSLIPFFALMALGAASARFGGFSSDNAQGLSKLVFWFGMPAVLVLAFVKNDASHMIDWRLAAAYAGAVLASLVLVRGAMAAIGRSREEQAGASMASVMGNTAFFAFPLVQFVFGPAAAVIGALILLIENLFIMPIAVAQLIAARDGRGWKALATSARTSLLNPIVLGSAFGLALSLNQILLPISALRALELVAGTATPAALFALGATLVHLRSEASKDSVVPVLLANVAKLMILPSLVFFAAIALGVDPFTRNVATLAAGAPTAVNVFVQARAYGVFGQGAARAVALSTLLSAVTLSVLIILLHQG